MSLMAVASVAHVVRALGGDHDVAAIAAATAENVAVVPVACVAANAGDSAVGFAFVFLVLDDVSCCGGYCYRC